MLSLFHKDISSDQLLVAGFSNGNKIAVLFSTESGVLSTTFAANSLVSNHENLTLAIQSTSAW